jgi:Tol biopolymer transport system component
VFTSYASNLVPPDLNEWPDVFVRDRDTDRDGVYDERGAVSTEIVSVATDGTQPTRLESLILRPSISPDGRYVAFTSLSSRLVPGDTNGATDVFLRDLVAKKTERVSLGDDGAQPNAHAGTLGFVSSISAGGRYVAFYTTASNLVPGDTNGRYDVFVRDRREETTRRVSVGDDGRQLTFGDGAVYSAISANGRFVAFQSSAATLVPADGNAATDVFVRDRDIDEDGVLDEPGAVAAKRVSITSDGREATGGE